MGRVDENRLGVKGWLVAGRYGWERYLYFLQRISGLGLIVYLLLHIFETASRLNGAAAWEETMGALSGPVFKGLEYVIFAAFVFHGINGIRLAFSELGLGLGKPGRPIYPYVNSLMRQRPLMWTFLVIILLLLIIGGIDFFAL